MLILNYENLDEIYSSKEEVKEALTNSSEIFVFQMQIESAHHYSDLAYYYLESAFIGDELTKFSERISFDVDWKSSYHPIVKFTLRPKDITQLSKLIFHLGIVRAGEDEHESHKFMEDILDYQETLEQRDHSFPELIDDYYTNYINGEYYEYDPVNDKGFFDNQFHLFPERKYGFFKSAFSKKLNQNFYASLDSLIIPRSSDIRLILKEYSGTENFDFIKAEFFAIGNITYLISDGLVIHFPFDAFVRARYCAWEALEPKDDLYTVEGSSMYGFLSFDRLRSTYNLEENFRGYPEDLAEQLLSQNSSQDNTLSSLSLSCFYISSYGDFILVRDSKYFYFFFIVDRLTVKELGFLGNKFSELFHTTANLAGIHTDIKCPWEQLEDQTFEDVCFDIIYQNPKFDNTTIRKMGKSRSRDGGRDIEVWTYYRPGKPVQKYIFQCKYQKPGTSLTASKLQAVSDTVVQYEASGYGIMTNVVIDAALYDKLDGISRNMKIEIEDYSVYRLERILACYPPIKQRHFKL